ncbi:MAG: acyl-CoA dehydrogenase family protein [Archangiaceae bacterium]|nr:acyl-CoA dehydrogenase family protein [Archangiaceae bacterium]
MVAEIGRKPHRAPQRTPAGATRARGALETPAPAPAELHDAERYPRARSPEAVALETPAARHVPIAAQAALFGAPPSQVEAVLEQADALAAKLAGTPDFLSPPAWRAQGAKFGLPGLDLPEEVGGLGLGASQSAKVFEHLGKRSLDLRDVVGGAHGRALLASDSPAVRAIARDVAAGKAYVAIAITEKAHGSDVRAMQSRSEKVPGGYVLTGEKSFQARLTTATHVVLFTRSADDEPSGHLNAFVLPSDYPGLSFSTHDAHGLKGNSFGGVSFEHLFVPDEFRLGGEGEGGTLFGRHFLYWRLMQSAAAIGTGKGALEQAVTRMREREAFGGPIGRFTHLQQPLAEHTAKLHMASLLVEEAAQKLDEGKYDEAAELVPMAKAEGVEWALAAADFAMKVHGAEGYAADLTDLGQRVRDLQGLRIADGTTDIMREEVVRQVYGRDLWDLAIGTHRPPVPEDRRPEDTPSGAIEALQRASAHFPEVLAREGDFTRLVARTGGGACPTVCAANFIQALGLMRGGSQLVDLDRAIRDAYRVDSTLEAGRLTNAQVAGLLDFFARKVNPPLKLEVAFDYQSALETREQPPGAEGWTDLDSGLFEVKKGELKMVSYTVENANGTVLGRHFVVLNDKTDSVVTVNDPNYPQRAHTYRLERVKLPEGGSSFRLVRPGAANGMKYTVNTVVTASLSRSEPKN